MTRFLLILAAILYLALIVLALRPATDLEAASLFFAAPRGFVGATPAGMAVRYVAWALPFVILAAMTLGYGFSRAGLLPPRLAPGGRDLVMMILAMALGPGLLVHAGLKEVSHRPRPVAVTAFGGSEAFRPWYRFDGACPRNCAFASGETAAATWTLAPASLVPPPWRGVAVAAAIAFAVATAVWRMALGAHFLSDVVGAMLVVIMVIVFCRAVVRRRGEGGRRRRVSSASLVRRPEPKGENDV